ncbi:MAG: DUF3142 domain-containing protein [Bryobacteraceae bacterium]
MRGTQYSLLLGIAVSLLGWTGCTRLESHAAPIPWTFGFWFWQGSSTESSSPRPVDALYIHAGDILQLDPNKQDAEWEVFGDIPRQLPPAKEYWIVFRYNRQGLPALEAIAPLARKIHSLRGIATQRNIPLAGVQLDVDSPTRALPAYADFLAQLRKQLPAGMQLSITCLLDWFRDGTSIDGVIREVDEFVPQFYDVANPDNKQGGAVAATIDPAVWGPQLNAFRKRYRIGVSTFGRARLTTGAAGALPSGSMFADLSPLELAGNRAFRKSASRNAAKEIVLRYEAVQRTEVGYNQFHPPMSLEFILPTAESVRVAVEAARKLQGYCAGVVFFRWPAPGETLTMSPEEVLAAAESNGARPPTPEIRTLNGGCATVVCTDLYLEHAPVAAEHPIRLRMESDSPLTYFISEKPASVSNHDPLVLDMTLPEYLGRSSIYLGRAMTTEKSRFQLREVQ